MEPTMNFKIRPYHPSDLSPYYRICLLTSKSNKDLNDPNEDPDLLGQYYMAPYPVLEPEVCFTLTKNEIPCGYIIGTKDSTLFYERTEAEWFPILRERYPMPSANNDSQAAKIIRLIHRGRRVYEELSEYPAHLHIDLLPEVQGQGYGSKMMKIFIERLRELSVPALHLGVGINNTRVIPFYERLGFHRVFENERAIMFGMHL